MYAKRSTSVRSRMRQWLKWGAVLTVSLLYFTLVYRVGQRMGDQINTMLDLHTLR